MLLVFIVVFCCCFDFKFAVRSAGTVESCFISSWMIVLYFLLMRGLSSLMRAFVKLNFCSVICKLLVEVSPILLGRLADEPMLI